jgi:hypothetical protein
MIVNGVQIKKTTLWLLGLLVAGAAASQVAWVQANVIPLLSNHPRLAPIGTLLLGAIALIHNPIVMQELVELTAKKTTDLPDGSTESKSLSATLTQPANVSAKGDTQ